MKVGQCCTIFLCALLAEHFQATPIKFVPKIGDEPMPSHVGAKSTAR